MELSELRVDEVRKKIVFLAISGNFTWVLRRERFFDFCGWLNHLSTIDFEKGTGVGIRLNRHLSVIGSVFTEGQTFLDLEIGSGHMYLRFRVTPKALKELSKKLISEFQKGI